MSEDEYKEQLDELYKQQDNLEFDLNKKRIDNENQYDDKRREVERLMTLSAEKQADYNFSIRQTIDIHEDSIRNYTFEIPDEAKKIFTKAFQDHENTQVIFREIDNDLEQQLIDVKQEFENIDEQINKKHFSDMSKLDDLIDNLKEQFNNEQN